MGNNRLYGLKSNPDEVLGNIFGEKYFAYRELWSKSMNRELVPAYPLQIDFSTSNFCNLKCIMCFFTKLPAVEKRFLEVKLYKKVIDEISELGTPTIAFGLLTEPFLHKDLLYMIEYARNRGIFDIIVDTNGLLLNRDIVEQFIESGVTRLKVSIDANSFETYKKVRGGSYDKVIRIVLQFLEARERKNYKIPLLRVSFVKMKQNIHELDDFIQFWRDKADYVALQEFLDIYATDKEGKSKTD